MIHNATSNDNLPISACEDILVYDRPQDASPSDSDANQPGAFSCPEMLTADESGGRLYSDRPQDTSPGNGAVNPPGAFSSSGSLTAQDTSGRLSSDRPQDASPSNGDANRPGAFSFGADVPLTCYDTYKDSGVPWIGEIPAGWGVDRLKHLATNRVVPATSCDGRYLGLEQVRSWSMTIEDAKDDEPEADGILYDADCVLFGKLRPYLAKVALPTSTGPCSSEFLVLIPHGVQRRYLAYLLVSERFIDEVNSLTYGVRMPRVGWDLIANISMPIPATHEQRAIVFHLDAKTAEIDTLVADCEREVDLLQEYRKAVISEVVTKGLDPDAPMKDSGIEWIGEIPVEWNVTRLKFLLTHVIDCPHETPTYAEDGEYLVIRAADQGIASMDDSKMLRLDQAEYLNRIRRMPLDRNDIVYGREGARWGYASLVPESGKYCLGQRMMQFRCDVSKVEPRYALYALSADYVYAQGAVEVMGSASPHVNVSTIINYQIALPPKAEQRTIVAHLDATTAEIDALIAAKQQMADKLREYRRSLISEAVTGKFKVPGA